MAPGRVSGPASVLADPVVLRNPPFWTRAERNVAIAAAVSAVAFMLSFSLAVWSVARPHDTARDIARQRAAWHLMLEQTFADMAVRIAARSGPDGAPADTWPVAGSPHS